MDFFLPICIFYKFVKIEFHKQSVSSHSIPACEDRFCKALIFAKKPEKLEKLQNFKYIKICSNSGSRRTI